MAQRGGTRETLPYHFHRQRGGGNSVSSAPRTAGWLDTDKWASVSFGSGATRRGGVGRSRGQGCLAKHYVLRAEREGRTTGMRTGGAQTLNEHATPARPFLSPPRHATLGVLSRDDLTLSRRAEPAKVQEQL